MFQGMVLTNSPGFSGKGFPVAPSALERGPFSSVPDCPFGKSPSS
jgi:hypothetical protein